METRPTTTKATTPVVRVVDWERVEVQYRAGVMSTREIGAEHGVSHTAINKRAKAEGWTRDLSARVKSMADAKVSRHLVSSAVAMETKITERLVLEVESDKVASVQIGHRKTIARGHALCEALLAELEAQTFDKVLMSELGELMRRPGEEDSQDRLNDIYKKVISTPGRVDTAKKLIETMKSVVSMEREAYNINAIPAGDTPANSIAAFLAGMKRSALPVVYEVEADDSL